MDKTSCGLLIKQIHDATRKHVDNSLRKKGLTLAQGRVLMVLGEEGGSAIALKELERRFHVAQSTIAGLVQRLEAKGFVEGVTASGDNRVKLVRLTPAGEQFHKANIKEIVEIEQRLLSPLTGQEQEDFLRMLRTVFDGIKGKTFEA